MQMKRLVEIPSDFLDQLKESGETGLGYRVISVELKDGKIFDQVAASEGCVIEVRDHEEIPFVPEEIKSIKVNHKRWNFRDYLPERKTRAAAA
jgi:hypothetical protein